MGLGNVLDDLSMTLTQGLQNVAALLLDFGEILLKTVILANFL